MHTALERELRRSKSELSLRFGSVYRYFGEGGLAALVFGGLYLSIVLLE